MNAGVPQRTTAARWLPQKLQNRPSRLKGRHDIEKLARADIEILLAAAAAERGAHFVGHGPREADFAQGLEEALVIDETFSQRNGSDRIGFRNVIDQARLVTKARPADIVGH